MRFRWLACVALSASFLVSACGRGHGNHCEGACSGHFISGTIHDSGGSAGLEGVTITLSGSSSDVVTTGPDGTFSFADLADGSYSIAPSREGFSFSPESTPITLRGADRSGVDFIASCVVPPGHAISGTVNGASAVTVTLSGAASRITTSDTEGKYSFADLAGGEYTVTPSKDGFTFSPESSPVTLSGADQSGIDFTASPVTVPGHAISGTILGASSVDVTLSGAASETTTTDVDGGYSFADLADGEYAVTPSKEGFTFWPESSPVTLSGADQFAIDFTASPVIPAKHSISGTVRGSSTATLTLSGAASATTTIGEDGKYSFTDLDEGEYTVTPSGGSGMHIFDPSSRTVTLGSADLSGVDFAEYHSICGFVTGVTITYDMGVTAWRDGASVGNGFINSIGYYFIDFVPPGTYTVIPYGPGLSFSPSSAAVTVDKTNPCLIDFAAGYAPLTISGTVHGASSVLMDLGWPISTVTDGEGRYSFTDLSNGWYTVTPHRYGYVFSPQGASIELNRADVTGVDFTASPAPVHSISGTILGIASSEGIVVAAEIDLTFDPGGPDHFLVDLRPDFTYVFEALPDWSYVIRPVGVGVSPQTRSVVLDGADATGIDFTATP